VLPVAVAVALTVAVVAVAAVVLTVGVMRIEIYSNKNSLKRSEVSNSRRDHSQERKEQMEDKEFL
jgi:hypothetical protein